MRELRSERWREPNHAYGSAADIPPLLERSRGLSTSEPDAEPWFSLFRALEHQRDVSPASFVAAPHVIAELERRAEVAYVSFIHFPAWVDVHRAKKSVAISVDLEKAYFESRRRLPTLAARAAPKPLERVGLACVLNAIAAVQG